MTGDLSLFGLAVLLLVGCATPVIRDAAHVVDIAPIDVQQAPGRYDGAGVIWAGRIVDFRNLKDVSEVEVVAYPIDRDQQPLTDAPSEGRFLLVLPGYVEALDYEIGRHLTAHGTLAGTREGEVQEQAYLYPIVSGISVHVWPWGFMIDRKPRIRIGIGVGIR
ncbi:MAG: Slp family lipoprotein [Dokdonella sp.]